MKTIKNKDIKTKYEIIKQKYQPIVDILNNPSLANKEKQLQIENYCISNRLTDINTNIYKSFPLLNKLTENILKHPFIRKQKEIFDYIVYLQNLNSIIQYTFNEIILAEENINEIPYTKIIIKLYENLEQAYKYKTIDDQIRYNRIYTDIDSTTKEKLNKKKIIFISIILEECEKANIIEIYLQKTAKQQKKMILFTKEYILKAYQSYINITNLPMIYPPNNWKIDSNKISKYGGYLCNDMIDLIHYNKDRSHQSTLKQNFIHVVNYLQSQSFVIDSFQLNHYYNNIESTLNNDIILIENFDAYLNQYNLDKKSNKLEIYNIFQAYNIKIRKICITLETLYLASIFKNHTIYFTIYNDFRNRLYYHSYLLNVQGTKLARSLIALEGFKIQDMCSLDATASGLQILGILTKNEELLNKTNLLNQNNEDIYTYYMEKFNQSKLNCLPKIVYNSKGFPINVSNNSFKFHSRKLFKKLLMTYAYNKEIFGMSQDIINSKDYFKMKQSEIFYHMKNLLLFFKYEFEDIELLKKMIHYIVDHTTNDFIIFNQDSNLISTQFYSKQVTKQIVCIYNKKRFSINLKQDVSPPLLNKFKSKRATLPNLIHSIDANLLYLVVTELQKLQIPIYTIHDCFVIPKNKKNILKQIYLNKMQYLYDSNILNQFIEDNITNKETLSTIFNEFRDLLQDKSLILNNLNGLKEENLC